MSPIDKSIIFSFVFIVLISSKILAVSEIDIFLFIFLPP